MSKFTQKYYIYRAPNHKVFSKIIDFEYDASKKIDELNKLFKGRFRFYKGTLKMLGTAIISSQPDYAKMENSKLLEDDN